MRKVCVFLRRDLREKWIGRSVVQWVVCTKCQRRIACGDYKTDRSIWRWVQEELAPRKRQVVHG